MRSRILFTILSVSLLGCSSQPTSSPAEIRLDSDRVFRAAFEQRTRNLRVEGMGIVKKILPEDHDGSRHQRFILGLGSGQTLLIAHNIDVASRIPDLEEGDEVTFRGEYDWNPEGGVIHWTHHDPAGRHAGGWLRHEGKTYE